MPHLLLYHRESEHVLPLSRGQQQTEGTFPIHSATTALLLALHHHHVLSCGALHPYNLSAIARGSNAPTTCRYRPSVSGARIKRFREGDAEQQRAQARYSQPLGCCFFHAGADGKPGRSRLPPSGTLQTAAGQPATQESDLIHPRETSSLQATSPFRSNGTLAASNSLVEYWPCDRLMSYQC